VFEVLAGGRDDPDVDLPGARVAKERDLAGL